MKGIEKTCERKGGSDNGTSIGQALICRAGGCSRDTYGNNEEIKQGVQVNTRAAPQGVVG
jgi:hypothetical protein